MKNFGTNYQVASKILYVYILSIMVMWIPVIVTLVYPNFYTEITTPRSLDDPVNTRLYDESDNMFNIWTYFSCFPGLMAAIPFLNAERIKRLRQKLGSKDVNTMLGTSTRVDTSLKRT